MKSIPATKSGLVSSVCSNQTRFARESTNQLQSAANNALRLLWDIQKITLPAAADRRELTAREVISIHELTRDAAAPLRTALMENAEQWLATTPARAATKHTITLYKNATGWISRNSDPAVRRLFGTDEIPTAFTAQADAQTVLAEIRRLNPDATVILR